MPTSGGRIFTQTIGGTKFGVGLHDISTCIGVNSLDEGTLCMNLTDKINMWAKFKPEITNQLEALSIAQRQANNFSIRALMVYGGRSALVQAVGNGTYKVGFTYEPPTSAVAKRMHDFVDHTRDNIGYNHYAVNPFGNLNPYEGTLSDVTSDVLRLENDAVVQSGSEENILVTDFKNPTDNYSQWYFGILLYANSSKWLFATATAPIINNASSWVVNFGHLAPATYSGEYTAYPVISSRPYTVGGSDYSDARIIGINSGVRVVLRQATDAYSMQAICKYQTSNSRVIDFDCWIYNNGTTTKTFTNLRLYAALGTDGSYQQVLKDFGTVTIPGKTNWHQEGSVTAVATDPNQSKFRYCKLQANEDNTGWELFMEPEE